MYVCGYSVCVCSLMWPDPSSPRVLLIRDENYLSVQILSVPQGGGTPIDAVLRAATAVKTKVSSQAEIFFMVNSQATISF